MVFQDKVACTSMLAASKLVNHGIRVTKWRRTRRVRCVTCRRINSYKVLTGREETT